MRDQPWRIDHEEIPRNSRHLGISGGGNFHPLCGPGGTFRHTGRRECQHNDHATAGRGQHHVGQHAALPRRQVRRVAGESRKSLPVQRRRGYENGRTGYGLLSVADRRPQIALSLIEFFYYYAQGKFFNCRR